MLAREFLKPLTLAVYFFCRLNFLAAVQDRHCPMLKIGKLYADHSLQFCQVCRFFNAEQLLAWLECILSLKIQRYKILSFFCKTQYLEPTKLLTYWKRISFQYNNYYIAVIYFDGNKLNNLGFLILSDADVGMSSLCRTSLEQNTWVE